MCVSTGLCAGRQYHLISDPKTFTEAQSYCREKYTDLATMDSMEDVETLNRMAENTWIGLYDDVNSWRWSLSDTSFYKHGEEEFRGWQSGEPNNYGDDEHCTLMSPDGLWNDRSCTSTFQAVCCDLYPTSLSQSTGLQEKELICTQLHGDFSFMLTFIKKHQTDEKNIQTQKNSNIKFASMLCVMLPLHSSSLDLFSGLNVTFVFINDSMTWTEAQSYCREHHTDLASVRDLTENQKVQELIPAWKAVWIGLFRDSWKWSDGSNSSFSHWQPGEPNNNGGAEACAAVVFGFSGRWVDVPCGRMYPFICYGPVPSKQVFRLRLRSSVDPNDPAVMEAMLEQFKQKLKAQGVNDDVTLSFRKQADGKAFHKEKKETRKLVPGLPPRQQLTTFRPKLLPDAPTIEALNMSHSGSTFPTTPGMLDKFFQRWAEMVQVNWGVPFTRGLFIPYSHITHCYWRGGAGPFKDCRWEQPSVSVVGDSGLVLADVESSLVQLMNLGAAWTLELPPCKSLNAACLVFMCVSTGLCAGRQYHLISDPKTFTEAQSYCREKYTDLATIDSMEDVETLNRMGETAGVSSNTWIGLYDDVNSWRWSLSDTSFYKHGEEEFRRWGEGEPNNYGGDEHCTSMYFDGRWHDSSCTSTLQAVCCDVRGLDVTFVLIDHFMTWTEAQSYCREHHTDLASVRDLTKNQKVQELIPAWKAVWIGLFRDSWKWSDGSNSSFSHWQPGEPNNNGGTEACAAVVFGSSGRWVDVPCGRMYPFICSSPVPSKQVFRLRLRSSVDPNDPAVMEAMLKQFKQKLKDQGVNDDVTLSFRKQADGKAFHKEKKKTRKRKQRHRSRETPPDSTAPFI
ncbi:uncharacterized protein LOC131986958 [Centropristis striata]|uniref:uncharacterized protein LOC131986958 n=1 Tax=Centropristis striata TaxID=184440 RepID=UPI0027DF0284|nr:uncharacterized protein LOC131986958 [Centropristis striata]